MRYFRNKTGSFITRRGREIAANSFFLIPAQEYGAWGQDDSVISSLATPADFTMSQDGSTDFSASSAKNIAFLQEGGLIDASNSFPFARKYHSDGRKLTRRSRGFTLDLDGTTSTQSATFTVPYTECLLTATEIINAQAGDAFKYEILDTAAGTVSTIPNYSLNTFGQDVYAAPDFYRAESLYDAALFVGLQVKVTCTPGAATSARKVFINLDLHELTV